MASAELVAEALLLHDGDVDAAAEWLMASVRKPKETFRSKGVTLNRKMGKRSDWAKGEDLGDILYIKYHKRIRPISVRFFQKKVVSNPAVTIGFKWAATLGQEGTGAAAPGADTVEGFFPKILYEGNRPMLNQRKAVVAEFQEGLFKNDTRYTDVFSRNGLRLSTMTKKDVDKIVDMMLDDAVSDAEEDADDIVMDDDDVPPPIVIDLTKDQQTQIKRILPGPDKDLKRGKEIDSDDDDEGDGNFVPSDEDEVWQDIQGDLDMLFRIGKDVEPVPPDDDKKEPRDGKLEVDGPPSVAQLNELTKFFRDDMKLTRSFRGVYAVEWGWLLWLQDNLPKDTLCLYRSLANPNTFALHLSVIETDPARRGKTFVKKHLEIDDGFFRSIEDCRRKNPPPRFVIGVLSLPGHSNGMIFDFEKKVITRFEPHGGKVGKEGRLDNRVINYAIENDFVNGKGRLGLFMNARPFTATERAVFAGWKYQAPYDFCARIGPQSLEGQVERGKGERKGETGGYCTAWSSIFMHFRVMNPHLTDAEASKYFTDKEPRELLRMIRQYAATIMSYVDKTSRKEWAPEFKGGDLVAYVPTGRVLRLGWVLGEIWFDNIKNYRMQWIRATKKTSHKWGISNEDPVTLVKVTNQQVIDEWTMKDPRTAPLEAIRKARR